MRPKAPWFPADGGIAAGTIVDDDGDFTIADPRSAGRRPASAGTGGRLDLVTVADMATLRELSASGTTDLTGLEFATGLRQVGSFPAATSSLVRAGSDPWPSLRVLIMPHWRGSDLEALGGLKTLRILEIAVCRTGTGRFPARGACWSCGTSICVATSGRIRLRPSRQCVGSLATLRPRGTARTALRLQRTFGTCRRCRG